jgi:FixJ family two-component response regulator
MRPIVVVIDADPATRQTLHALLSSLDVEVAAFDSAENFLAQAIVSPACCVVNSDVPCTTGLQLLRQLRASARDVPLIFLSTDPDITTAVEAMRLGAIDCIEKSRMDVALLRRISQVVHNSVDHAKDRNVKA